MKTPMGLQKSSAVLCAADRWLPRRSFCGENTGMEVGKRAPAERRRRFAFLEAHQQDGAGSLVSCMMWRRRGKIVTNGCETFFIWLKSLMTAVRVNVTKNCFLAILFSLTVTLYVDSRAWSE